MLNHYPKGPENPPKQLTTLSASYLFRACLAILAIFVFFVLYLLMVTGLAYLVYYAVIYDMISVNKLTILLKIGAIAGSAMLFVFTLKFIFKLKNHKPTNRIKLSKEEYPEVWGFILQICKDTNAPKPKSIYADPDVNAYVMYTNTWLSLFLPVRKDLTIGLGLVSCLNISEFKAVMSHEFGHFAQKSMKIGSYIMSANTIIHDMIFERDKWDDLLDQWRASDFRLSAAAWVITPIVWLIRQMLNLFYQFLNIMNSSLSREMEFNADKVAVKTTGSDAIISGLWKLDGGNENWNSTINHAYLASQKKIFTNNLYAHNNFAIERGAAEQNKKLSNLSIDNRGGKLYFSSSESSKVGMYASHPPNDKREDSAKVPYVHCIQDETSAWVLFGSAIKLQEEMTQLVYKQYINKKPESAVEIAVFENFIKAESVNTDLFSEFSDTFQNRFIEIPVIEELESKSINISSPKLYISNLKKEIDLLMVPIREIESLMIKAQNIAKGTTLEKSFSFSGKEYTKKNISEGYHKLTDQRENLFNTTFKEWDEKFCGFYLNQAAGAELKPKLTGVYKQHATITKIYKVVIAKKVEIHEKLEKMQSNDDLTQSELNSFGEWVNTVYTGLNEELEVLDNIHFIPMPNIDTVTDLKEAIIEGGVFTKEIGPLFENGGFDKILVSIENTLIHCQRLDQKSICEILLLHKEIERSIN